MATNPLFFCDWDFISTPIGDNVSLFTLKRCLRFEHVVPSHRTKRWFGVWSSLQT